MLRVLVLAPFPPRLDATYGGGQAVGQLVLSLTAHYRVALLCLRGPEDRPTDPLLARACDIVEEIPQPCEGAVLWHRWRRRVRLARGWLSGRPMWATDARAPALGRRAQAIAHEWRPDIVQVEFHVMTQYLPWLRGCAAPRVLTEHDPGVYAEQSSGALPGRLVQRLETQAWRRFTDTALSAVHAAVVFTERDRQTLESQAPQARLVRIPLAIRVTARPMNPLGIDPPTLLFVGSFSHSPNVDAALRMIRNIFPALSADFPQARLWLVGDQPTGQMRAEAPGSVIVTGLVADVEPYLDQAAVVVAPLRLGGGMRVKVLDALGAGKAVVASRVALAGIDVRDGEHVLVAETDQEFAQAIGRLLRDPLERAQLAARAYAWASTNLTPEQSFRAYDALYRSLLK
jgi:glycosyltransferase involved in cell wall biosynthesis